MKRKIDVSRLKKVSTYAKEKNISVQQVYNWVKYGKCDCEIIDGVYFVVT